jgi:ATP-dependent helicase/nuclease subunit A
MRVAIDAPQISASDPSASVFVMANAGSGKTSTLVKRVARLLLRGAAPDAILCVTYTKAAAAEMQRRLFAMLGEWAVMEDASLSEALANLNEATDDLSEARALFARALETPGGLKIQTIHAFCEKLLKRFPLEAGVSPGFKVLEDTAAAEVSAMARDDVARLANDDRAGPIGAAYAYLSVQLSYDRFNDMFANFEARRRAIGAYVEACGEGLRADIWGRCGFDEAVHPLDLAVEALAAIDWRRWALVADILLAGTSSDQQLGQAMKALSAKSAFEPVLACFCTTTGQPKKKLGTQAIDPATQAWLYEQQRHLCAAQEVIKAARVALETEYALTLAIAYARFYEGAKTARGGLDFGDLIERVRELLTVRADAAWVLYKLDGGIDHILLDEAQDTASDQWDILRALTAEFFAAEAQRERTAFAVGDEKQSIYSFQGAEPERFAREAAEYRSLVEGAGRPFAEVPLLQSYRSTPEVLSFVDAVFRPPNLQDGLRPGAPFAAAPVEHLAFREDHGTIDLWPVEEAEPAQQRDPWAPVDYEEPTSANRKSATRIAAAVKAMIASGEARPADVLILVRRRNVLFHDVIRALKAARVPVGGADRLKLSKHIVFDDMIGLARFCLFAGDDLTLAALLRSPFCDVDEDGLYALAQPRKGSLWSELNRRAREQPEYQAAVDFLGWAKGEAQRRPPFDFFGRVLTRLDAGGRSMRARMLSRLGREAEDAIDAFMGEALKAEGRGERDLETFVAAMASSEIEVKREQEAKDDAAGGEVRVMTVHGAKGLESKIVILPDTTTRTLPQYAPLLETGDGGFLWAPRKPDDCPASADARAIRDRATDHESLRLLYVALTRARDRLIICGVKTKPQFFTDSWRDICEQAFKDEAIAAKTRMAAGPDGVHVVRYGPDPSPAPAVKAPLAQTLPLPDWARELAPAEIGVSRYASPSTLAEAEKGPAPSPLTLVGGLGRYRRGELIHKLLQLLPDIEVFARPQAALALLERERDLTPEQRTDMADAALGVLNDERFAAVFGQGSRAEVAIAGAAPGLPDGLAVSGRVDRLVIERDRVLVVDFKTNRPSPSRIEQADRAYLTQMAVYAAVLRAVFPGRRIEAALVWTDGPKLMPIPEELLVATLAALPRTVDSIGGAP